LENVIFATRKLASRTVGKSLPQPIMICGALNVPSHISGGIMASFDLLVNGQTYTVEAERQMPVLWVLRDLLGLTGTKFSCGAGLCGSCTVLIDDEPARSCVTFVESAAGKRSPPLRAFAGWLSSIARILDRRARYAVRLLPARADHERGCPVEEKSGPKRCRYRRGNGRCALPLRDVSAHSGCHSPRGRGGVR
jgi:hypothetical protein